MGLIKKRGITNDWEKFRKAFYEVYKHYHMFEHCVAIKEVPQIRVETILKFSKDGTD